MKFAVLLLGLAVSAGAQDFKFPPDDREIEAALAEMPDLLVPGGTPVGGPFSAQISIWYNPPIPGLDSAEAKEYGDEAERLAAQGLDFPAVFAGLCRHMLSGNARTVRNPRAETANMFRGLIRWTRNGGKPVFQGRGDWPVHFIYGGYLAAVYGRMVAEGAAYAKENRDAKTPGNFFDLDDLAITLMGARWASSAGHGYGDLKLWAEAWASGRKSLGSVPLLQFGPLPHGLLPSASQIERVLGFVRGAI